MSHVANETVSLRFSGREFSSWHFPHNSARNGMVAVLAERIVELRAVTCVLAMVGNMRCNVHRGCDIGTSLHI